MNGDKVKRETYKPARAYWWWLWPEWLCRLLTKHAQVKKWARYNCDMQGTAGTACRCGWYYTQKG